MGHLEDELGDVAVTAATFLFHSNPAVQKTVTTAQRAYFTNFIHNEQQKQLNKYQKANERPPQSLSDYHSTQSSIAVVRHPDHAKMRYAVNKQFRQNCSPQQQQALLRIVQFMKIDVDTHRQKQMLFYLSGEGGTGKSMLIDILRKSAKVLFGLKGPMEPMLSLAPTGSAAFNIDGFTWHNALALKYDSNGKPNQRSAELLGAKLMGTEVICIDENSLLGQEKMKEISNRLQYARAAQLVGLLKPAIDRRDRLAKLPFGGFRMLFSKSYGPYSSQYHSTLTN